MCLITEHAHLKEQYQELQTKLLDEATKNCKLQQEVAKLLNPPKLLPCGAIDYALVDAIVRAKAVEIEDRDYEVYIPDTANKVYNKADVVVSHELEEVSLIPYIDQTHDCDDFSAELFGKFAGLVWTNLHAFNWFIDETDTFWYIEPQTRKLSQTIDGWQGNDVRFFVGR